MSPTGPPIITLKNGTLTTFSLLPPAVNRADIPILTQNVKLSTNLVGRWQIPDGSYVNSDTITIPTINVSHAGLYKFYVTNWNGDWTPAIQIYIPPIGKDLIQLFPLIQSQYIIPSFYILETYTQTIIDLSAETSGPNSILVAWRLSEVDLHNIGTFSVYLEIAGFEILAGKTKFLFYELERLAPNINYTIRVELQYPYSALVISSTTHHFLALNGDGTDVAELGNANTQYTTQDTTTEFPNNSEQSICFTTMHAIISVLVIFITMVLLILFILCGVILCVVKRRSRSKLAQQPQVHANEIYRQVGNIHPPAHANKAFLCTEGIDVSKQTDFDLDVK